MNFAEIDAPSVAGRRRLCHQQTLIHVVFYPFTRP